MVRRSISVLAMFLIGLAGCAAEAGDDESENESGAAAVTNDGPTLAIPTYMDRAESVCPASHPKRKADQMGFGNQHDQCCYGIITPYCTGGATAGACAAGEAYVIGRGVDRCAKPVEARKYVGRGAAKCDAGFKLKIDPAVAESRTPIFDRTIAARDTCCKGSTCAPPRCADGEQLAAVDGPDQCVRIVDTERFRSVGTPVCPAGTTRVADTRSATMDVCCGGGMQQQYPSTCEPLIVIPNACPAGAKVVSLLGDDECVTAE